MENRRGIVITIVALTVLAWEGGASGQLSQSIGNVMAVQREVLVTHPGQVEVGLVNLEDSVLFKDIYETKAKAKLKLLFEDDSLLTLGENTKIQITENIFDPTQNRRSTIIDILNGTVRTLVGKIFTGADSRFEIHTPTAVAAARGTYFIVWTVKEGEGDPTGVVNIGESGIVEVSNIDPAIKGSMTLGQNQYTLVEQGKPPAPPAMIEPGLLVGLLTSTEIKDQAIQEVPKGREAPGSDVSGEMVTPIAPGQTVRSVETAADDTFPTVPPITQQPPLDTTGGGEPPFSDVDVEIRFP